ncbi:MAG: Gfo/Idh/MocA family oxidoreductase [Candidatus Methylacidiphilales bacterium]|nr:Gfo/Idh/MocA family oxidoreductase [Candidatus Methylacidiphilales bacterium]
MQRRSFLQLLAASSLGVGFPSLVKAQTLGMGGGTAPSNRITLALVGAGNQGPSDMRNAMSQPGLQVVAICDPDRQRRLKVKTSVDETYQVAAGEKGCADYNHPMEAIQHPDLDAVLIATPDHWHALATLWAARAGKHIYLEKPVTHHIAEGRPMIKAVERAGIVCQVGCQQRSSSEFIRAIDLVRNGFLGRIQKIEVGLPGFSDGKPPIPFGPQPIPEGFDYDIWVGPAPFLGYHPERCHYKWRWNLNFGGGQLADWIEHHYDIAALAMNVAGTQPVAIREASAEFVRQNPLYDVPTSYSFQAHYADNTVLHVSSKFPGGIRFEGDAGWLTVTRGQMNYSSEVLRRAVIPSHLSIAPEPKSHMASFLDAIRTGCKNNAPLDEAHNIATVAHLANAALRSNRSELLWDPATESLQESLPEASDAARILTRTYRAPYVLPA